MLVFGIFFVEVIILFLFSQSLTKALSAWFYYLFKSQTIVIQLLSILFLPGVIVHELSHLLTASMLFVPTGDIEFLPEIRGDEVKMGSVSIAHTDPFRRFLIGVAPLLVGLSILFLLFWYFLPGLSLLSWQTGILLYAVFEISNTMFSSRKDMEGAIALLIFLSVVVVVLVLLKINFWDSLFIWLDNEWVSALFLSMSIYIGIAVVLDGVILALTHGFIKLHRRF